MNLSIDHLRAFARGVCEVRHEDRGVYLDRMNAPLRALYGQTEGALIRARCGAGICLRFRSDTAELRLHLQSGRTARPFRKADLFVDGTWLTTAGPEGAGTEWKGRLFAAARRAPREFELWLPHCAETWIASLEIEDGSLIEPLPPLPHAWLAIGDSITQGMTATAPARAFAVIAARRAALDVHNIGVGGATMEAEAGRASAALRWDIATVAFGCNDWNQGRPPAGYEAATRDLLAALRAVRPDAPILLITPLPVTRQPEGELNKNGVALEDYREILRRTAMDFRAVNVIEGPDLVPADPACFADGVHPNDAGMALIGERLAERLAAGLSAETARR